MKLIRSKKWYEKRIDLEQEAEIGAGIPGARKSEAKPGNIHLAFGTFVELWRRNKGWNALKLADKAGVGIDEILEIERNPYAEPESTAVYKLAEVFGLSPKPLLELAGLTELSSPRLRESAVQFAAKTEPVTALSKGEREALEAFVSALSETSKRQ